MENEKGLLKMTYELKSKGVFKWAFALAAGLAVGKAVGDIVGSAISGTFSGFVIAEAKSGNKVMQNACDKAGVKYKDDDPKETK